jgi:hypothetical protein
MPFVLSSSTFKNILKTSHEEAMGLSTRPFYMLTALFPSGQGTPASINISLRRTFVLQQSLARTQNKLLLICFSMLQIYVKH